MSGVPLHMEKFIMAAILSLCYLVPGLSGQDATVRGKVTDPGGQPIQGATAVLLNPADSVMQFFSVTDAYGAFQMQARHGDSLLLQVSFLGCRTYYEEMVLDKGETDLGTIVLEEGQQVLEEVIVSEDRIPIRIKGDTLEYDAGAFQTKPNATVEELFQKLPGVQVESDGTVKTQGKEVQKVLVDGKEFFGDDPKIATKNLPAEAVDKVQVFDKKSDVAEFTGVDDGVRDKTINLSLKDSHKQGRFGNISAGYGDQGRYRGKTSLNQFSKKTRLSFIGSTNNINEQSFSFSDYLRMNGGLGGFGSGRVRIEIGGEGGMALGGLQNGINTGFGAGLNLTHDFTEKSRLQASYFFNGLKNVLDEDRQSQEFFPAGDLFSTNLTDREQHRYNHRLSMRYELDLDSTQQVRLSGQFGFNNFDQQLFRDDLTSDDQEALLNASDREQGLDGNENSWNLQGSYLKKFNAKTGRFISFSGKLRSGTFEQAGLLNALNTFYESTPALLDTLRQEQLFSRDQVSYEARVSYTEPIGKRKYVELIAEYGNDRSEVIQDVYNLVAAFPEKVLDEELSNAFDQSFARTSAGGRLQQNFKSSQVSVGGKLQRSILNGEQREAASPIRQEFLNFLPFLSMQFDFTTSNHLNIDYRTSVNEPTLRQLQSVVDNSDPLNIYIGNPDLRPEYSHALSANYFSFSQFSGINLFGIVEATYTRNMIVNAKTFDEFFRQTTQPINTPEAWRVFGNFDFGSRLKFLNLRFNVTASTLYDRYESRLNGAPNPIETFNHSYRIRFDNRNKEHFDIALGGQASWQVVQSAASELASSKYRNQSLFIETALTAMKNWRFEQSFRYQNWQGIAGAEGQKTSILNLSVSRYFMDNRLELKFQVMDVLNQNRGLTQNAGLNSIEFVRYNALGRYFMLSAQYSLKKFGNEGPDISIEKL